MIETLPSFLRRSIRSRIMRPFLGAHRRQGLVEQDDVGVAGDRPRHRDRLALAAGQARHRHIDAGDVDPDLSSALRASRFMSALARNGIGACDPLAAQEQVVVDGELVDQRQVLEHGVDAALAGVVARSWARRLSPLQPHRPRVRLLEPAEDLDQRRLAGAVVSEQPQHLALAQVQVDVAQRDGGSEALGDVLDAQHVVVGRRRARRSARDGDGGIRHGPIPSAPGIRTVLNAIAIRIARPR